MFQSILEGKGVYLRRLVAMLNRKVSTSSLLLTLKVKAATTVGSLAPTCLTKHSLSVSLSLSSKSILLLLLKPNHTRIAEAIGKQDDEFCQPNNWADNIRKLLKMEALMRLFPPIVLFILFVPMLSGAIV